MTTSYVRNPWPTEHFLRLSCLKVKILVERIFRKLLVLSTYLVSHHEILDNNIPGERQWKLQRSYENPPGTSNVLWPYWFLDDVCDELEQKGYYLAIYTNLSHK